MSGPEGYEPKDFDGAEINGDLFPEEFILPPNGHVSAPLRERAMNDGNYDLTGDPGRPIDKIVTAIYSTRGASSLPAGYDDLLDA